MAKKKLARFAEMDTFDHVVQAEFSEVFEKDYKLKGNWNNHFFKNNNPIILELGCGKGEYTVGLAGQNPQINFIGIDIKGARMWKGAKTALDTGMKNVGFVRTRIDLINSFFAPEEISEIWITFPDPQPKKYYKRLTSTRFLGYYQKLLVSNGFVHLKTDSQELHTYTRALVELNHLETEVCTDDLYNSGIADEILSIKTFYEQQFLQKGKPITYIKFKLDLQKKLEEPEDK